MKIYELNKQVEESLDKYYNSMDLETGEVIDETSFNEARKELEELQNKKEELTEWVLKKRANTLWQVEWVSSEIKRLSELKQSLEKQVDKANKFIEYLTKEVLENNKKVIIWNWQVWYRESKATIITEDFDFHSEYWVETIKYTADKKKIKEDLENWKEIIWAYIENRKNLFIK